jgi:hypothetical protein
MKLNDKLYTWIRRAFNWRSYNDEYCVTVRGRMINENAEEIIIRFDRDETAKLLPPIEVQEEQK